MDEQRHYKQDKTITRQSINVKRHIFNVISDTEKFEERDLNIGGDCQARRLLIVTPKGGHLRWVASENAPLRYPWTDSMFMDFLQDLENE
ncbi:hypothetical protein Tco_1298545 [Tanacetum coccineum]